MNLRKPMIVLGALACMASPALANPVPVFDETFGERVKSYLMEHPEVILQAIQAGQQRAVAAQIDAHKVDLFNNPTDQAIGNKGAAVTIVEFFDYNCTFCKAFENTLTATVKADSSVRLVFKEYPILGPGSVEASRIALAAAKAGKYAEVHDALISHKGRLDPDQAWTIAAKLGIDKPAAQDAEIDGQLNRNHQLAGILGASGTPFLVIGHKVYSGLLSPDQLRQAVAEAQAGPGAK